VGAPFAIDEQDQRLLAMLAEHRVTVLAQVQLYLREDGAALRRRVDRLVRQRLVGRQTWLAGQPDPVWLTRRGREAISSKLPAPRPNNKDFRHDVGVGWLWLAAQGGAFGTGRVISERAMHSHDGSLDRSGGAGTSEPLGVGVGGIGPGGHPSRHYPDLVIEPDAGGRIAVELELSAKRRERLDEVMLSYATDPRITSVIYLAATPKIARSVREAAARAGLGELVQVAQLAPDGIEGAPAVGQPLTASGAARSPARTRSGPPRAGRGTSRKAQEAGR
jgi:hypothetical protein